MIHVSWKELQKAFRTHYSESKKIKEGISCNLLLFYAVECGLKSLYMKKLKLTSTAKIRDDTLLSKSGHDLSIWFKYLNITASEADKYKLTKSLDFFRLIRDGSQWQVEEAHQAWRYNVGMNPTDEKILVEWLKNICTWIEEKI